MNTSNSILVIDVNVIIHLDKAGLLDKLINDDRIRIVDLVLYDEYQKKRNLASDKVEKIKKISLNEKELEEALILNEKNPRNSFYDYCSYIVARDNNCILLSSDWKLKKNINYDKVHGVVWYVKDLYINKKLSKEELNDVYNTWNNDLSIYIKDNILKELIDENEI